MVKRIIGSAVLILALSGVLAIPAIAQEPELPGFNPQEEGMPGRPGIFQQGPGMRQGMMPFKGGKPPRGEEMEKQRQDQQQMQAIRVTAEAHKNLAELFMNQSKVNEAASELRKILDLFDRIKDNEKARERFSKHIAQVYIQISDLYGKNERNKEAEDVLNEGIAKLEKIDLESASHLALHMGQFLMKNSKPEEAEKAFQKVIKLNSEALKSK